MSVGNSANRLMRAILWGMVALMSLAGCRSGHTTGKSGTGGSSAGDFAAVHTPAHEPEAVVERRIRAAAAYATGIGRQMNDDLSGALEQFGAVLQNDPEREGLALEVAQLHLQRREYTNAIQVLTPVSVRKEASMPVFLYLGLAQLQLKQWDAAATTYQEALRRKPDNMGFRGLLAQVEMERQRPEAAWQLLLDAEKLDSKEAGDWLELSEAFLDLGNRIPDRSGDARTHAGTALERAASLQPESLQILPRLAERLAEQGKSGDAEKMLIKLQDRFPDHPFPAGRLAELYLRSGRNSNAIPQLERVRKAMPANAIPVYYLGLIAMEDERHQVALGHFSEAIRLNASYEPAYLDLAGVQLGLGQPSHALETLDKARKLFPKNFRTEFIASLAHARLQAFDKAVQSLLTAEIAARGSKDSNRLDHRFYFQLGAMHERTTNYVESDRYMKKALAIQPDYPEALNHLGYSWADRGEHLEEALAMIRRAVDAEPENEAYLDSLAWVLFKLGRPLEARPWIEKAVRLAEKPDATLQDHLGDILAAVGDWKGARSAWKSSLTLEPSESIQKKLNESSARE